MKTALLGLAASAAALSFALPATAAETLQVVSGPAGTRAVSIANFDPIGQTFTAFTDTITSVGFQFASLNPAHTNDPITLRIFAGETLSGTSLFTNVFTLPTSINSRTPQWFDIAVPSLAVTNGQRYSLVLETGSSFRNALVVGPDFNPSTGQFAGGDAYAGGRLLSTTLTYANCAGTANNCDANFRVTGNLVAAAVPEPGAWAMMIVGFLAVGGAMRAARTRRPQLTYA